MSGGIAPTCACAYLYLRRHPLPDAIDKMCAGVKRFNAAKGVEDGPT